MKELIEWAREGAEIMREMGVTSLELYIGGGHLSFSCEVSPQIQVGVAPGAENPFRNVMTICGTNKMLKIEPGSADALRSAVSSGPSVSTSEFLDWMADRLVEVYGEDPGVDFVLSCRERARQLRHALRTPSLSPLNEGVDRTD